MDRLLLGAALLALAFATWTARQRARPIISPPSTVSESADVPAPRWYESGRWPALRFVGRSINGLALVAIALAGTCLTVNAQHQATQLAQPRLELSLVSLEPLPDANGIWAKMLVANAGQSDTTITSVHVLRRSQ
jgi:hypothetical protein